MAPFSLFVATAILAFTGVDAAKDKIKVLQFADPHCNGHPIGKQFEIKRDECRTIHASGVRLERPKKDKYLNGWLDQVNKGHWECYVSLFSQPGCPAGSEEDVDADQYVHHVSVPADLEKCSARAFDRGPNDQHPPRSIKFYCLKPAHFGRVHNNTLSIDVVSWSIEPHGHPTASLYTTTVTAPRWTYPTTTTATIPTTHPTLEPRAEQTVEPRVVRGQHYNAIGVWMKHPWGRGEECFECWTKKSELTSEFKCQAGPDTSVNCGKRPSIDYFNKKYWTTSGPSIVSKTTTVTEHEFAHYPTTIHLPPHVPTPGLQERSEKRHVKMEHPFVPGHEVCAKANWHHAGVGRKQRVDIKGPKDCKYNQYGVLDKKYWPIDIIKYTAIAHSSTNTVTNTVTLYEKIIYTQPEFKGAIYTTLA